VEGDLNLEIEHFRYHRRMEMEQVNIQSFITSIQSDHSIFTTLLFARYMMN
jgi:hypothetical protein